jgi:hypothetical protein
MPIDAHNQEFLEGEARALRRRSARDAWLIEQIARHFPGLAPAIRAVGQHVLEHEAESGSCCEDVAATQ